MKKIARMTPEEVMEAYEMMQSGDNIGIDEHGDAYLGRRLVAGHDENFNADFPAIRAWCNTNKFWPDVVAVNDHGNITVYGIDGIAYGDCV